MAPRWMEQREFTQSFSLGMELAGAHSDTGWKMCSWLLQLPFSNPSPSSTLLLTPAPQFQNSAPPPHRAVSTLLWVTVTP